MSKFNPITVYEEFASKADKRKAQVGAKRGKPTDKNTGFIFVYGDLPGRVQNGTYMRDAYAAVFEQTPGSDLSGGCTSTSVSDDFLRERCRRVGGKYLTGKWKAAYDYVHKNDEE